MLSFIMVNDVMLSDIMLNVVAPKMASNGSGLTGKSVGLT